MTVLSAPRLVSSPPNPDPKLASGQRPNVIDLMKNKDMALVINTPSGNPPAKTK